jgi:hypothetical protein
VEPENEGRRQVRLEKYKKAQETGKCLPCIEGGDSLMLGTWYSCSETQTMSYSQREQFKVLLFSLFHFSKRNISHTGLVYSFFLSMTKCMEILEYAWKCAKHGKETH